MTINQQDALQRLARRIHTAALAVAALGTTPGHQAVEDLLGDVAHDLQEATLQRDALIGQDRE